MKRKDGSLFWCSLSGKAIDPSVLSKGFIWILEDITKRKQEESELRLRSEILGNMAEGVFLIRNADWQIVYANQKFERMFGYDSGELVGKHVSIVNAPCEISPEETAEKIFQGLNANGVWQGEVQSIRKDGTTFWCNKNITPYEHSQYGKVWISINQDITERKIAEEQLRKSENKYRTLIENLPQKIFYKDRNSVYISCNKNLADDLGIKPDEFAGRTDYDFFPKELAEKYRADDKRLMELGKTEDIEEKYREDGQEVWIYTVKTPVVDDSGNVTGILGIFWDITDRKKTEEALKESEERLRQAIRVSRLAYLITTT